MTRTFLALLALAACGPPPSSEETEPPVERCVLEDDAAESRLVEIGAHGPSGFEPYQDGQDLALVWGMQGGVMITPAVRVEEAPGDPARLCVSLRLTHELVNGEAPGLSPGIMLQLWLDADGEHLVSPAIDDLLEFDPEPLADEALLLTAIVDGPVAGTATVEVVLRSP